MNNSKEKISIKDRLSRFMLWVLFALLLISIGRTISKIRVINERILDEEKELQKLEEKNSALKKQLDEVNSDYYIEKQIRDKLGLSKEGEVVLVLPSDELLLEIAPKSTQEEGIVIEPNWQKWFHLFGLPN